MFAFLIVFNSVGYYFLFYGLSYSHKKEMIRTLDADTYEAMESVIIKVPLSIPYASGTEDFERVDGEFEYQGEYYRMVKQRLSEDTLYVVCIKDAHQTKLNQAEASFIKNSGANNSGNHAKTPPPVIKDYLFDSFSIAIRSNGWQRDVATCGSLQIFIPTFHPSVFLPPDERG